MNIALKEWASVIRALETGRQVVLLRKGGISEVEGRFEVTHSEFLLYPTFEHQDERMLRREFRNLADETTKEHRPGFVRLNSCARVREIIEAGNRADLDRFVGQHVWEDSYLDMRLAYKPERPLYVLVLQVYRLAHPVEIPETPHYAGCRSWVNLEMDVATAGAIAVLFGHDSDAKNRLRAD